MASARDLLLSAVEERRPIVLVLGQDACPDGEDTVLTRALDRLGKGAEAQRGWSGIRAGMPVPGDFYEWLAERFTRRVPSQSLDMLGELPWSAVFTSTLDPTLRDLLVNPGREPEVILTADETPRAVRSRARPPIYHLFSRAGEQDPNARPPANLSEFNIRRTQHSMQMLNRVLDTATTLGLIVVDGYVPGRDWLRIDDFLGTVGSAAPNQILWFGGRPELGADDADQFNFAVESGRIIVEPRRLSNLISEILSTDRLRDLATPDSEDAGIVSFIGHERLETTPEERLRVEAVASIVDDSWNAFLPPLGPDADYALFRRFHGDFEGPRLLVEGVRRNFAIERDFEADLMKQVSRAVANHARVKSPIMVKGQSGTGKSVALARMVARVRSERLAAVLYAMDRIPQPQEVSSFCEKAEDAGAKVTLIVCDANRDVDLYHDLLTGLRSRGRRVVVVGSQYYTSESQNAQRGGSIEAPVGLSTKERNALADLLDRYFEKPDPSMLQDNNILAFMYRFLPPSRPRIRAGLGDEALATERVLRRHSEFFQPPVPFTPMHLALIKAGLADGYQPIFDQRQADALEQGENAAGQIIDWVMVAGSLNCPVPFNLLLRAAKARFEEIDLTVIADLFRELDLFRWVKDSQDNDLLVSPRLTLEAQLICRRRLGAVDIEAKRLIELIGSVRFGIDRVQETNFLLSLLQQIGSDGPYGERHKNAYADIGRKLTDLRTRFSVLDPRLMLQESAFRRSAVRANAVDDAEHLGLLEEAREAVQQALDGIDNGEIYASDRTKQNLLVERATVYGFLATYRARSSQSASDVWPSYQAARDAVKRAVNVAASYYPLDVGLWTPADLLNSSVVLSDVQRAELAADIYSNLDQVELDALPPGQQEKFQSRRMRVGDAINDAELAEDAYDELEKSGSSAGYFLRARSFFPNLSDKTVEVYQPQDVTYAERAASFLDSHWVKIGNDGRCLSLLLECKWIAEMKRRPLHGERQPLPFDLGTRRDVLRIVQALNRANGESARHATRYLEAVITWLIGEYNEARGIFRNLANDTDYENARRVIRRHVISDANGEPCVFSGRVERGAQEGRWVIRIDNLGQTINLLSHDFPSEDVAYGRPIEAFAVAFNFIGPIAEPIR